MFTYPSKCALQKILRTLSLCNLHFYAVIVFDQLIIERGCDNMENMWNSDELRNQVSCKPTETCLIKSIILKNIMF